MTLVLVAMVFVMAMDATIAALSFVVSPREMRGFYREEWRKMWREFKQGWNGALSPLRR